MRRTATRLPSAALALAAVVGALPAAAEPLVPPPVLAFGHGFESAAAPDAPASLLWNPAGVGARYPSELAFTVLGIHDGGTIYRGAMTSGGFALGMSGAENRHVSYGVALGGGSDRLRLGGQLTWTPDGNHGRRRDLRFGFLSRPAPWLSLGGVVDHAAEPTIDRVRFPRTWVAAVGIRPLALSRTRAHGAGPRFTLTGDLRHVEGEPYEAASWHAGGEFELSPGVVARALYFSESRGVQLGLSLLSPRTGVHGTAGIADQGDRVAYHAVSVSSHDGEDRTALATHASRRIATIAVRGALADDALSGFSIFGSTSTHAVAPLHRQLERALEDPLTRGVLLELGGASNMAQLEELRPRIARLRAAGKPVVAYLEGGGGRGDLYLASACDAIVASPEAPFLGLGLRVERRYYRKLLADWGIRLDRASHGAYKSAYRNFSVDSTTTADAEVIGQTLDEVQELFVSTVTADRKIDRERLLPALDGRSWRSRDLANLGVIDSVGYREDATRLLGRLVRLGDKPRSTKFVHPEAAREWTRRTPIAVVYASGSIETGTSGNDLLSGPTLGAETISRQIEKAFRTPGIRAVVLRVESPGGSSLASDLIHHRLERVKRETGKPLIVSMGSLAASGGYHISLPADRIYADRFTRTGSIGVLFVKPSIEGWYRQHHVRQDEFERGPYMRGMSLARDWDARLQAHADSMIRLDYRDFVDLVARSRGLSWEQTDQVAQGRVWLGEDAQERRLVDEIGGIEAALAEARRRAKVPAGEKIHVLEFRRPRPGIVDRLIGSVVRETWDRAVRLPEPGTMLRRMDEDVEE